MSNRITLPEPVARIYDATEELQKLYPGRKFTPDGHLVGSIGEVVAAEALGLIRSRGGAEAVILVEPGRPGHAAGWFALGAGGPAHRRVIVAAPIDTTRDTRQERECSSHKIPPSSDLRMSSQLPRGDRSIFHARACSGVMPLRSSVSSKSS